MDNYISDVLKNVAEKWTGKTYWQPSTFWYQFHPEAGQIKHRCYIKKVDERRWRATFWYGKARHLATIEEDGAYFFYQDVRGRCYIISIDELSNGYKVFFYIKEYGVNSIDNYSPYDGAILSHENAHEILEKECLQFLYHEVPASLKTENFDSAFCKSVRQFYKQQEKQVENWLATNSPTIQAWIKNIGRKWTVKPYRVKSLIKSLGLEFHPKPDELRKRYIVYFDHLARRWTVAFWYGAAQHVRAFHMERWQIYNRDAKGRYYEITITILVENNAIELEVDLLAREIRSNFQPNYKFEKTLRLKGSNFIEILSQETESLIFSEGSQR